MSFISILLMACGVGSDCFMLLVSGQEQQEVSQQINVPSWQIKASSRIEYQGKALPVRAWAQGRHKKGEDEKPEGADSQGGESAQNGKQLSQVNLPLTRLEAIELLLTQNQQLEIQRMDWDIKRLSIKKERGMFEPELVTSVARDFSERENTVEQTLNQFNNQFNQRNKRFNSGIEGLTPTGAKYRFGYSASRLANNLTIGQRDPFDSEYVTFLGVNLTQPLLKDAWWRVTLSPIRLAREEAKVAFQDFRKGLIGLLAQMESRYWDLVLAQRKLEIHGSSVQMAEKILTDSQERLAAGKISELELADAEVGLATRRAEQTSAQQELMEVMNELRNLFSGSLAESNSFIVATDQPQTGPVAADYSETFQKAMELNPDYLRSRGEVEKEKLKLSYARNQRLPRLDLVGSYGLNGLGDDMAQSWQDVTNSDFKSWSAGVELTVPLGGGISAKHESRQAKLRKQQALLNFKNVETELSNSIDSLLRKISSYKELIGSSQQRTQLNQRVMDVEMTRFEEGKSDSRKVLEVEEDLLEAKIQELQSLILYEKSLLFLDVIKGSLLDNRNIEIKEGHKKAEE